MPTLSHRICPARIFLVGYLFTLTGCAHYEQLQDARHGQSVRAAIVAQTADPWGVRPLPNGGGLDGETAREAFRHYLRSLHQRGAAAEPPAIDRP
jgi:hypothetical protein